MARKPSSESGPCIVCGSTTRDWTRSGGRYHWRCADGEECAVRRNRRKKRPQTEAAVRAEWRERRANPTPALNPNPYLKGAWARHVAQRRASRADRDPEAGGDGGPVVRERRVGHGGNA